MSLLEKAIKAGATVGIATAAFKTVEKIAAKHMDDDKITKIKMPHEPEFYIGRNYEDVEMELEAYGFRVNSYLRLHNHTYFNIKS